MGSKKKTSKNIFISHSSENREIAEHLCALLSNLGVNDDRVFCSSRIGQGVANGEKLNNAIAKAISKSSLILYLISRDFLDSSYCMEELGVGWYLDIRGKATCFFLILPDIELSELKGFINSKINKFQFIDKNHKDELSLLIENLCDDLGLRRVKHSSMLNVENMFNSAIDKLLDDLTMRKKEKEENEKKQQKRIYELEDAIDEYREENRRLSSTLEMRDRTNKELNEQIERNKLQVELDTIRKLFCNLGLYSGIKPESFRSLSKGFWFSMLNRYYELLGKIEDEENDDNMEMLAASIYSANGNLEKAYEHLVEFVRITGGSIYPLMFENITISDDNSMDEIVHILKEKKDKEPEGLSHDSYSETLRFIAERNRRIKEAPHA